MKFNLKTLIIVTLYFSTSNWIITDYFFSPNVKNYLLGILLVTLIIYLVISEKYYFNFGAFLFSAIGLTAVLMNGAVYTSLLIQHFFLFIFSFYFIDYRTTMNIYKTINRVNYVLISLIPVQMFLFYSDQSLLSFAGPVSSTGLDLGETVEIRHWISYLGSTTTERYDFLGRSLPRFSGYLTEPSAVPNLVILPLLIEAINDRRKIISHGLLILFCVFIYRSGFVTIYVSAIILLILLHRARVLSSQYFLMASLGSGLLVLAFLPTLVIAYLDNESAISLYSLTNKSNTAISRTMGVFDMISNIKVFGNHAVEIYGVGILVHYLILYGYPILFFISYLGFQLYKNCYFFEIYLLLFSLLFLSKGFSSIFPLVLLLGYATYGRSRGLKV